MAIVNGEMIPDMNQPVVLEGQTEVVELENTVEEVSTVADKILEDTQWLRNQLVETSARLQVLTDSPNQALQQTTEIKAEITSLRQEIRNLKDQLSELKAPLESTPLASSISQTQEPVETVTVVEENAEEDPLVPVTPPKRRRKI